MAPRPRTPLFYAMVAVATVGGTLLALSGVNPIRLPIVVAIVIGVTAAPFLNAVMLVSNDRRIMDAHRNGKLATTIGWLTTLIMTIGAIVVFATGGF